MTSYTEYQEDVMEEKIEKRIPSTFAEYKSGEEVHVVGYIRKRTECARPIATVVGTVTEDVDEWNAALRAGKACYDCRVNYYWQ